MKITGIRTVLLTGPSTDDPYLRESRKRRSAAYIEILTDTELVGIGETYAGYFIPEAVPPIVDFFAPVLVGQGVENIAELWRRMYQTGNYWCRVGLGVAVINGIEAALWDLKGKMYGVPVYELLGGRKHDALPAYATGGPSNYPLERLAAKIDFYLSTGRWTSCLRALRRQPTSRAARPSSCGVMLAWTSGSAWTGTWAITW